MCSECSVNRMQYKEILARKTLTRLNRSVNNGVSHECTTVNLGFWTCISSHGQILNNDQIRNIYHTQIVYQEGCPWSGVFVWIYEAKGFTKVVTKEGWSLIRIAFNIMVSRQVVIRLGDLWWGWSLIRMGFDQGSLSWGWYFLRVVSHEGGISLRLSLIRVAFHQGGLLVGWLLICMIYHQGYLSQASSEVFHCRSQMITTYSTSRTGHGYFKHLVPNHDQRPSGEQNRRHPPR